MFANWYEVYLQMKARERTLLVEAEQRRRLTATRSGRPRPGSSLKKGLISAAHPDSAISLDIPDVVS